MKLPTPAGTVTLKVPLGTRSGHELRLSGREADTTAWTFEARWLVVAKQALRIRRDFELDPHGVSVVLRYLERIGELEAEVRALRARFR